MQTVSTLLAFCAVGILQNGKPRGAPNWSQHVVCAGNFATQYWACNIASVLPAVCYARAAGDCQPHAGSLISLALVSWLADPRGQSALVSWLADPASLNTTFGAGGYALLARGPSTVLSIVSCISSLFVIHASTMASLPSAWRLAGVDYAYVPICVPTASLEAHAQIPDLIGIFF